MEASKFNKLMAEMVGFRTYGTHGVMCYDENEDQMRTPDYYSDLNLLMPLAWKHRVDLLWVKRPIYQWQAGTSFSGDGRRVSFNDPIEAIRQCLIAIAEIKLPEKDDA